MLIITRTYRPCALFACCLLALYASAVGWRTDGTGHYPDAQPPIEWAVDKNVLWSTPLPNWSNASPVLVGDRIFVCAEPATLLCVDRADGKIRWQRNNTWEEMVSPDEGARMKQDLQSADQLTRELRDVEGELRKVADGLQATPDDAGLQAKQTELLPRRDALKRQLAPLANLWYRQPGTHPTNGYTSATPVSDGRYVYVLFGTGIAACYDLEGTRQWITFLEKSSGASGWGHCVSPVLSGKTLLLHMVNLYALDATTGTVKWKTSSPELWGTPVVTRLGDVPVLVTAHGDILRIADGTMLTRGVRPLDYNSPVVADDIAYFIQAGGKAVKLPATDDGTAPQVLWQTNPKNDRYYAAPLIHQGLIYDITQAKVFSIIDAATGAVVYTTTLELGGGTVYPSPCLAGNRLFISSESGVTIVMEPGNPPTILATNRLEPFRATPVFDGNRIYIRTLKRLYCLGTAG